MFQSVIVLKPIILWSYTLNNTKSQIIKKYLKILSFLNITYRVTNKNTIFFVFCITIIRFCEIRLEYKITNLTYLTVDYHFFYMSRRDSKCFKLTKQSMRGNCTDVTLSMSPEDFQGILGMSRSVEQTGSWWKTATILYFPFLHMKKNHNLST